MRWRWIHVACALTALGACTALPRSRQAITVYGAVSADARWALGTVEVEHVTMADRIQRMVGEAIGLVAAENGLALASPGETADVVVDLWISEREFARDLRTTNSISVTASLRDAPGGVLLLKAAYAEETGETLGSFYHLYSVLDAVCATIADRIRKEAGAGE